MELIEILQKDDESLWEFVTRYYRVVLDFSAFNHLQALRGLKEGVKTMV